MILNIFSLLGHAIIFISTTFIICYFFLVNQFILITLVAIFVFFSFIYFYTYKFHKYYISYFLAFVLIGISIFYTNPSIGNKRIKNIFYDFVVYLKFNYKIYAKTNNLGNDILAYKTNNVKDLKFVFTIDNNSKIIRYENGKVKLIKNKLNYHIIKYFISENIEYFFTPTYSKIGFFKDQKVKNKNFKFHHWPLLYDDEFYIPIYTNELKDINNFNFFKNSFKKLKNFENCEFDFKNLPIIDGIAVLDKNLDLIENIELLNFFYKDNDVLKLLKPDNIKDFNCNDFLHLNYIYKLNFSDTLKIKDSSQGDLLLTFRSFDGVILINKDRNEIIYYFNTDDLKPHNGFINKNNNLVLFGNYPKKNKGTQILEIDPSTNKILGFFYDKKLQSITRGQIIEIKKNQYLVVYSNSGKIAYVTCKGFINNDCAYETIIESKSSIAGLSLID